MVHTDPTLKWGKEKEDNTDVVLVAHCGEAFSFACFSMPAPVM